MAVRLGNSFVAVVPTFQYDFNQSSLYGPDYGYEQFRIRNSQGCLDRQFLLIPPINQPYVFEVKSTIIDKVTFDFPKLDYRSELRRLLSRSFFSQVFPLPKKIFASIDINRE